MYNTAKVEYGGWNKAKPSAQTHFTVKHIYATTWQNKNIRWLKEDDATFRRSTNDNHKIRETFPLKKSRRKKSKTSNWVFMQQKLLPYLYIDGEWRKRQGKRNWKGDMFDFFFSILVMEISFGLRMRMNEVQKKKWMHRTDCCGSVCVLRIFARFVTLVNCNLIFPACLVNGIWICLQFAVCSDCWIWMCAVGCRNRYIFTSKLGRNFDRQAKRYCNYMISYDALHHILQCKQIDEDFEQVAFMSNECEGSLLCFQCKFHNLLFAVVFDSITENHN